MNTRKIIMALLFATSIIVNPMSLLAGNQVKAPSSFNVDDSVVIEGIVTQIDSINIDKSGKHPRYTLFVSVKVTKSNHNRLIADEEVIVQGKDKEFLKEMHAKPVLGDKVRVKGFIINENSKRIYLRSIQLIGN